MTMIISGSDGLEFPDNSDQTTAFTGNAATITSGTLNVARLPSSGINAASITVGTLAVARLPSSGVNAASITVGVLAEANGGTGTTIGYNGFKNRIINGAMVIDQRNAGASITPNNQYTLDRWVVYGSQASKFTIQQNAGSVTPPSGFINYAGITSSSAYTVVSSDEFEIYQWIEGFNTADLRFGTANASTVTLSFWVRSSLTGTFGGALQNSASNRSYVFSYTISAANTWEQKTITISGDISGNWLITNGRGIGVFFGLGQGSSLSTTAGSWVSGNFNNVTGATSVVGTNGATFYITGVQLEKGSTATSFDYRPYGTELALCQRYFFNGVTVGQLGQVISGGQAYSTTQALLVMNVPVSMRVVPSLTFTTNLGIWNATGSSQAISALAITESANNSTFRLNATVASASLVAGNAAILQTGGTTLGVFTLSSEL
jgi:uncharacterized protein affecting Mg2+/Co2+ transport